MGEAIFSVLQVVGLFAGGWLLPLLSGGRLIVVPRNTVVDPSRLAPWARMPDGKIGVDGLLVGTLAAVVFLFAIVGLCCLIL